MVHGDSSPGNDHPSRRQLFAACGALALSGCTAWRPSGEKKDQPSSDTSQKSAWRSKRGDAANTAYQLDDLETEETETAWRSGVGNITSPPAILGDTLFTGGGRNLYAINVRTGDKHWMRRTRVITGNFTPTVSGNTIYAAGQEAGVGRLFAMTATDGSIEWQDDTPVTTSPIAVAGSVFLGSTRQGRGILRAIDGETGEEKWRSPVSDDTESRVGDVPAVVDGVVYCSGRRHLENGDKKGQLFAVDAETGRRLWTNSVEESITSSPAVRRDIVYFADTGGTAHALDAKTGDTEWTRELDGAVQSSPAIGDDTFYLRDTAGVCHALDAMDGRTEWRATTESSAIDLTVGSDTVYAGGNALYAIDRADGAQRWKYEG